MKTHIAGPIRLGLVSALAINAGLCVAHAQESTTDEDGAKRLGAITVTAQRREQNLIDVPLSVTAFDLSLIHI